MSQALTLEQSVILVDSIRNVSAKIGVHDVEVTLHDIEEYETSDPITKAIPWEQLDDVEHLVSLFEYEAVKTFKTIVEMLGKIHSNKDIYLALL